jgi:HlyD family secretion protein
MRTIAFVLVVVGVVAGGAACYFKYVLTEVPVVYRTAPVTRGDLVCSISATGIVVAEDFVDVGARVAGTIENFGPDPDHPGKTVDFNTVVHQGMLLATIDPTCYKAQVEQADAALQSAEASLMQLQAKFEQAKQDSNRAETLRKSQAIADTDYDTAVANNKIAEANVAMGKATVRQAKATLDVAKINLGYTDIKSPIEGVVVARRVNVGQTVVASLNAPSLFLIAKDLRRMQVWASVNEADIGRIGVDTPVQFTVDAVPNRVFRGKVSQIRLNAQTTQNVITFTVVVTTDNLDGKLLPYLTANLQFETDHRSNVLLVPNAALRWKPQARQIVPDRPEARPSGTAPLAESTRPAKIYGRFWAIDDDGIRPVKVQIGISDGTTTEISGADVDVGTKVVVGEDGNGDSGDADAKSPFIPQMRGKKR